MKLSDLGIGTKGRSPVPEYEADGDIARVYHEVRQSLRVTGVNLVFRAWAAYGQFLPAIWDELRGNVESAAFEAAVDEIRKQAEQAAGLLDSDEQGIWGDFGASSSYQIGAALELYHYINPKLLVLVSAVRQALQGGFRIGPDAAQTKQSARGEPAKMYPMEMESDRPDDKGIRKTYSDIRKTLSLSSINSDYRTLALWPDYLNKAWQRLKPICRKPEFRDRAHEMRDRAKHLTAGLPYPISFSLGRVKELGEDPDELLQVTQDFERLLPELILNIAILRRGWARNQSSQPQSGKIEPPVGPSSSWRLFQKRQKVLEVGDQFLSYIDEGEGEAVVLLHGIPAWSFLWDKTISALSPHFRVLAPDLLGYGYSSKRDNFDRSIRRQAEVLNEALSMLKLDSVHLVGHDLGGGIALRLATLFPDRVRSLCLVNSVCYDAWPVEMMLQLGHPSAAREGAPSNTLKLLRKGLLAGFHQEPESDWFDGLLSPWRTEVGRLSLVRDAVALNTNDTTEITRLLPAIRVPALVLWGEDDSFLPVRYGEMLAKDIPGATLARFPAARHFVMIDQPDRVNRALEEFLRSQPAQAMRAAA